MGGVTLVLLFGQRAKMLGEGETLRYYLKNGWNGKDGVRLY